MKHAGATEIANVVIDADDQTPQDARQYAHDKIASLGRFAPEQTAYAHVRVSHSSPRTVAVHANLDVNGTSVVAQAEAGTATEAIDGVRDHLHRQLLKMHN
ncbi:HPF/RaiA family ribosome-associated protein [Lentzea sp. NBC_00516]|uniref:HPF/RaiA family ribosome-associated protein n=1 Tax=Lentzea sp. NBC_00516 TaxID=2903582 RepID=UPI002E806B3C|nr:HPF/RaiA family ribosome-associated protein [Lentzea sp. NBC_00516]WUD27234.1 HPF/RaiA family ribosome-associated protein [Lentzea sp. NBC_00516]